MNVPQTVKRPASRWQQNERKPMRRLIRSLDKRLTSTYQFCQNFAYYYFDRRYRARQAWVTARNTLSA